MGQLDAMQVIKKCFDATNNALRISGTTGSLGAQITFDAGLGAITQLLGPSDQALKITSDTDENVVLNALGTGILQLGTAGDANALEVSAAGAVAANGALTCNESLILEDDIVLKVASASSASNTLTLDWALANIFTVTTTENITTITVSNPTAGHKITIVFTNGGAHTVGFPGGWKWPGGTAPTISPGAGDIDVVTVLYDGTNYLADFGQLFS